MIWRTASTRGLSVEALDAVIERHAKGIERHRDNGVVAHGKDKVHKLRRVVTRLQRRPGRVADAGVLMELVHGPQQGRLERRPTRRVRTRADASNLGVA